VKQALAGMGLILQDEAHAGRVIGEAYAATGENALLADVQGLPVTVVSILQADGTVIQERINGLDGLAAISAKPDILPLPIFEDGFVNDPQAEIERVSGLVLGLHALHQAGKVHHDLKLENIMIERRERKPDELLAKIDA
jgi:hypothetical protein